MGSAGAQKATADQSQGDNPAHCHERQLLIAHTLRELPRRASGFEHWRHPGGVHERIGGCFSQQQGRLGHIQVGDLSRSTGLPRTPSRESSKRGVSVSTRSASRIRVVAYSLAEELRGDALAAGADAFVPRGAPVQELFGALAPADCDPANT
jgi:hypothetical protein